MWNIFRGGDSPPSWVTSPSSPFSQAPGYFQVPLYVHSQAAFGYPSPPLPIGASSGAYSPYDVKFRTRALVSTTQRTVVTTMHTHHHYSNHHVHVHRVKQSHNNGNEKSYQAKTQPTQKSQSNGAQSRQPKSKPTFSKCTGRKKALCIGINYKGQHNELHGCINDARNVQRFLIKHYNYQAENIFMLTDDTPNLHHQPTRANIIDAMRWLVRDAQPHDSLFLHYSGHGGQTKDLDGDEVDGLDEVIFPVDYKWTGHIVDDVKPLPRGCRLTYHMNGRQKGHSEVTPSHMKEKYTEADVTSADTWEAGAAVGAMSYGHPQEEL
ncbi:hypothetical protein IEO21_07989 [Rhodonia placenta]|uniref:Peptidase C14 caspase domain-containing protein n=1 Tax=Rhodonia placenta TaxID=104341 RepID=A0A8H7NX21_9APHY|nr:hypothetical protein IEO21_07989 [Postia placenta]